MTRLSDIPVRIDTTSFRHMALPLLHEVRHALQALADSGATRVIDLLAIPFGPGDENLLLQVLGRGEVHAEFDALGPSRVWETAYGGVWVIDHRDADDKRIAFQIEISRIPEILCTPLEDLSEAALRLEDRLQGLQPENLE